VWGQATFLAVSAENRRPNWPELEYKSQLHSQIVKYAPWMIGADSLKEPAVQAAVAKVHAGSSVPPAEQQSELLLQLKTGEVWQYVGTFGRMRKRVLLVSSPR
jgi:hypothetical protein